MFACTVAVALPCAGWVACGACPFGRTVYAAGVIPADMFRGGIIAGRGGETFVEAAVRSCGALPAAAPAGAEVVPFPAGDVPPAWPDGVSGMTCTPATCPDAAASDACAAVFCLACRGGMTGLIFPACWVSSVFLPPYSGTESPCSCAASLPESVCNVCSGGRGVTGDTIWLACPSVVRCGMTGGNLPFVCVGFMRPKFSGSGRFGGAGGVTLPPASEMVSAALLFFSTLLLI